MAWMEVNAPSEGNEPRSFEFVNVAYADLTGDDREEAVVTLSIRSGGTSRTHCIFVYTLSGESPELLWVHETGDRAVEGLRNAYIQDRSLVIEQYDPLLVIRLRLSLDRTISGPRKVSVF